MKTLIIKDLALTKELGRSDMAAVRGGHGTSMPWMPEYSPKYDSSIKASQDLMQLQDVQNLTANGSAFVSGVHVTNNTDQFGQNNLLIA
ncbi:hypothetical protein ACI48D_06260 [Massilia sp. LXY-6]|uniref:hypothetical protein n=1 Tax=Massilia sp. LXY-6 TaxID=3379823 RepID=UPI003EE36D4D